MALVATVFFSFGLWVHHSSRRFHSCRARPFSRQAWPYNSQGIQVFSWIATIAAGRLRFTVPSLFVLGFMAIFVIGGLTGVMVAMVPFDWQAHDTFFIVAHLHYVLFGGMVFPLFAAIYYWVPTISAKPLSERLGRWSFGLLFIGFNVTFFPANCRPDCCPRGAFTLSENMGGVAQSHLSTVGASGRGGGCVPCGLGSQFSIPQSRTPAMSGVPARSKGAERCIWHPQLPVARAASPGDDAKLAA